MRPAKAAAPIVTLFGIGRLPWAPGSWGSLAALPPAWLLIELGGRPLLAAALVLVIAVGIVTAGRYEAANGAHDPPEIVIDEVAGQWLALLLAPPTIAAYAAAFVLFRFFDILKPWPISTVERRTKGGWGVMADDLAAGLAALIGLEAALFLGFPA